MGFRVESFEYAVLVRMPIICVVACPCLRKTHFVHFGGE